MSEAPDSALLSAPVPGRRIDTALSIQQERFGLNLPRGWPSPLGARTFAHPTPRMDLRQQVGHALGPSYDLQRELGGGGMSRVFVARETDLGRDVVVKVLPPEMAASVSVDRFRREIQVGAQLQHPHIVPVLAAGAGDSLLYYTMPYIDGESLRARLARGMVFTAGEATRVWREVLDALSYAHSRGVVHRDIKPENILLANRHAVVTDFGIARAVAAATDGGDQLTATGIAIGTPAYMAPEQAAGDKDVDHRADLYSAGLVMYEMLSGAPPFAGASLRELTMAHLSKEPPPLVPRDAACPPALVALVMRCLAKDPSRRPQSADVILAELEAFATPGATRTTAAPRRGRMLAIAAASLLFAVLAVAGWAKVNDKLFFAPSRPANDTLRLAVLIAENTFDRGDSTLARGYADAVVSELTKDPWIVVFTPSILMQVAAAEGFPASSMTRDTIVYFAHRGRVSAYITLGLARATNGYVLSAEAKGARNDNTIGVINEAANTAAEIPAAIQRVAVRLRRHLVAERRQLPFSEASYVLENVAPRAIQYYMDGRSEFERRHWLEAAARLRLAVREDSNFGEAWGTLAAALGNAGGFPGERIRVSAQQFKLRGQVRSPAGRLSIAGEYWRSVGRPDRSVATFDSLLRILPPNAALNNQGLALETLRRPDQAERVFRKASDTTYTTLRNSNSNLVRTLVRMGKLDTARDEIARLRHADSLSATTMQAQFWLAAALRDWNTIESQGRFWAGKPSRTERIRGLQYLRVGALARGRVSRFDSLSTQRSALLRAETAAGFLLEETVRARAMVEVLGDAPRGRRIIDSALASLKWDSIDVLDRQYSSLIQTLAVVGDTTRALAYAAEWSRMTPAEFRMVDSLDVVAARGNVALASGRPAEAIRLWRIADVRGCEECFMAGYAQAFDAMKQSDSARVWYEKFLATYETGNTFGDASALPRAYRRLGELYEEHREWDKALKMYQKLAAQWENADASLQPTVQDIKARIQRLRKLTG